MIFYWYAIMLDMEAVILRLVLPSLANRRVLENQSFLLKLIYEFIGCPKLLSQVNFKIHFRFLFFITQYTTTIF